MSAEDRRPLDWSKVTAKLISDAKRDVHDAEEALRRAKSRLTFLEAVAHRHESAESSSSEPEPTSDQAGTPGTKNHTNGSE